MGTSEKELLRELAGRVDELGSDLALLRSQMLVMFGQPDVGQTMRQIVAEIPDRLREAEFEGYQRGLKEEEGENDREYARGYAAGMDRMLDGREP